MGTNQVIELFESHKLFRTIIGQKLKESAV